MNRHKKGLTYNKIDFVVKAPKFHIAFSYTDDKGFSFIREYILRLLKLSPCRPEQIAAYFDLSQKNTEIALDDLYSKQWIEYFTDGNIGLSNIGKGLFKTESGEPRLFVLRQKNVNCHMELLGENFLEDKFLDNHRLHAIELLPPHETLADSKNIAAKNFQNRFLELKEDDFFDLNGNENHKENSTENGISGELYNIDDVNIFGNKYFRFTQEFKLDENNINTLDRNDVTGVKHTEKLEQAVTAVVAQYTQSSNLNELIHSMETLADETTLKLIASGFNTERFQQENNKQDNEEGTYFLGQIYHQKDFSQYFEDIFKKLKDKVSQSPKKLFWLAPTDVYWGVQNDIRNLLELLNGNSLVSQNKEKKRLYNFRMYLPLNGVNDNRAKKYWIYQFRDYETILYGFKEGFLNDNTEIIVFEDNIAIVCYHTKLPQYDVTFPIGFITRKPEKIRMIMHLVESYLNSSVYSNNNNDKCIKNDFGKLA